MEMKHLLELNEFDVEGKIDGIINRIMDTGYISSSMSKELDRVTGVVNVTDKLYKKANQIDDFYKNSNSDFFDDVLLEFFEGTTYNYTVKTGIYLPDPLRWTNYFGNLRFDRNKKETLIPDEWEKSSNKESFLFCFLMNFIKYLNTNAQKSANKYDKELREKPNFIDRWNKFPRQRNIDYTNYFKYFLNIQPYINLSIVHKLWAQYYYEMDMNQQLNLEGWTSNEYNYSLTDRIKKRLGYFNNLGKIVSVTSDGPYSGDTWTPSYSWNDEDERVENPNQVLVRSNLSIKFDIND